MTIVIALSNGWKIVTRDESVLERFLEGATYLYIDTDGGSYHVASSHVVCIQEVEE